MRRIFQHLIRRCSPVINYSIKDGYKHRLIVPHFDDTSFRDEYQLEVYQKALDIFKSNGFQKVIDIGCGSGFKLVKFFPKHSINGVEVEPTLTWLKNKYPSVQFYNMQNLPNKAFDIVICSDVIEHIYKPDIFIKKIKNISAEFYIFSTPAKELLSKSSQNGPPNNKHHFREWTKNEFHEFLGQYFNIVEHYISSYDNATQLAVCKLKKY